MMNYQDLEWAMMALMNRVSAQSVLFTEEEFEKVQDKTLEDVKDKSVLVFDRDKKSGKVIVTVLPLYVAERIQTEKEKKRNEDPKKRR